MLAEVNTSPNDSAEEEEPTSAELLYRIGEALEAGERTHNSISQKQKPVGFVHNEAMVKEGIASFVQLVKSINKVDGQLDFPAAMDWLGRESKTGKSHLAQNKTSKNSKLYNTACYSNLESNAAGIFHERPRTHILRLGRLS